MIFVQLKDKLGTRNYQFILKNIMNKTLIVIAIIIVIIGGFFLFFGKSNAPVIDNKETTSGANEAGPQVNGVPVPDGTKMETGTVSESVVTVTYNGSVFSPKTITVKKGDSVTFINESNGGMSVASDPHPSHTIYPEFDQYKSAEKGKKSYTFVFDKIGSWGYHNHLNSSAVGMVTVE
ncbi:MAG: hypothetical protein A2644_00945 [Candidatus Zambryskibacteria bacterium RIFCSPHIGHO2_01_FULL_39_63]|nr:MAG: hypothetical protein A2644_00945 [Candidatus Zambryskibacteria bacterium RIFCSPHIGHO2_01_FULL_39_63]OHA94594.1 MAG: hypothetical protein A3B88_00075 [Candidatus Zambryskibacteria bacterium RIFCSPHIGHO2_02_FULL_39_19]OHA98630.1 MAG: hypothetical protein A3F20_00020 [Candidatus Zambryskibacteria bacterium RIFCSPHIGHO2_12_FULL_39_21]